MSRRARKVEQEASSGTDKFVGYHGDERIGSFPTKGAMLSKVCTYVLRTKENNLGSVRFEPVLGPGCTVYIVRKVEGIVAVETVNNIN